MSAENAVCFHCGLSIPRSAHFTQPLLGQPRHFCCAGCEAIALAIHAGGLDAYYRLRETPGQKPGDDAISVGRAYDLPEIERQYVTELAEGERAAELVAPGMSCAACAWLIERHLLTRGGAKSARVHFASRRISVSWDSPMRLGEILRTLEGIGFRAWPAQDVQAEEAERATQRQRLRQLGVAGLGMMQAGMVSTAFYVRDLYGESAQLEWQWENLLRWTALAFALPVVFYSALPFFRAAWQALRLRQVVMDTPVALAIALAFIASVVATVTGRGEVYFDSVTMFVFFLLAARVIEERARQRSGAAWVMPRSQMPLLALRLDAAGNVQEVPLAQLQPGERLRILPGAVVPCDGRILLGESEVSEAWLTGEALPVKRAPGEAVLAGSVNGAGALEVEITALGQGTRLAALAQLQQAALASKPRIEEWASRAASWFVLFILLLAGAAALVWGLRGEPRWLAITLSVLAISCPCALALSVPAALAVAHGVLRRQGFFVLRGSALMALARADTALLDKTGTLTCGQLRIERIECAEGVSQAEALRIAAALESVSAHPLARAFAAAGGAEPLQEYQIGTGGITGKLHTQQYAIGNAEFIAEQISPNPLFFKEGAKSNTYSERKAPFVEGGALKTRGFGVEMVIYLAEKNRLLARFTLSDPLREQAGALITGLQRLGLQTQLLSGDPSAAAGLLARRLGIAQWQSGVSPEAKLQWIRAQQARGRHTLMLGDGINDAPALAAASVSIAVGQSSDLAQIRADALLPSGQLATTLFAVRIARACRRIIAQNLSMSLAYNLTAVPLAALGFAPPWAAALGMSLSSLLVTLNALRIARMVPPSARSVQG